MLRAVGDELVIATHNPGKLREFRGLLRALIPRIHSSSELKLPEPEETGLSFEDNALLKARAAASASGKVALADDSGLCVEALNGDPGIYSARWAGPEKNFSAAMKKIHDLMGSNPNQNAHFMVVLALVWPDGSHELFEGRVDGVITWPPRGTKGHGYDPFFVPQGLNETFAEMAEIEKNTISHRGQAVQKLLQRLKNS